jgi:hypothetical protein
MERESYRKCILASPRKSGARERALLVVRAEARWSRRLSPLAGRGRIALAIRVRGSLRMRFVCNPGEGPPRSFELQNLRKQPLTPTLSPQARGEGAH